MSDVDLATVRPGCATTHRCLSDFTWAVLLSLRSLNFNYQWGRMSTVWADAPCAGRAIPASRPFGQSETKSIVGSKVFNPRPQPQTQPLVWIMRTTEGPHMSLKYCSRSNHFRAVFSILGRETAQWNRNEPSERRLHLGK
jgi:hypothetical protein